MRKLWMPVALCAPMLLVGISGCKLYRTADQPDQADELARLQDENQRLRNQLSQPRSTPSRPATMSPGARDRLGKQGIGVSNEGDNIKMTLPNTILFSSGSASLRSDSRKALEEATKVIKQEFPGHTVVVQGHTDNEPIKHSANKFKSNYDLSVARATAVADSLKKQGVRNKLKVEGFGETRPLNDNKTAQDRAKNRRVEIVLVTPGAPQGNAGASTIEGDDGF